MQIKWRLTPSSDIFRCQCWQVKTEPEITLENVPVNDNVVPNSMTVLKARITVLDVEKTLILHSQRCT